MAEMVVESARNVPVVAEVDVVVVGGSCAAVAAAIAAAGAGARGARVFLVVGEAYLGADLCAPFRFWPETMEMAGVKLAEALFAQVPPTPLQIKGTLAKAALEAGVTPLLESFVTEVLRDENGALAGVVIGNRSGRQAIVAKVIIDATPRASVARIAGATFAAYPAGPQRFVRRVMGGEAPAGAKVMPTRTVGAIAWEGKTHQVYEYALELPMADGSVRSFAAADQMARDLTWREGQAFGAEVLWQVPPDAMEGEQRSTGVEVEIGALRPRGMGRLLVLGGCADVSREVAEKVMAPVASMRLGEWVGLAAAEEAKGIALSGSVAVGSREEGRAAVGLDTREMLGGFPGQAAPGRFAEAGERALPVLGTYDVVVVGGGTAGASAAIGAARQGAKVLVIEYLPLVGGTGTVGMIARNWYGNVCGFTAEVDDAVADPPAGKEVWQQMHGWNIQRKAEWLRKQMRAAGVEIWLGCMTCGAVMEGSTVRGAIALTPAGRGAVLGKVVIDATGNADLAAAAGVPCRFMGDGNFAVQGAGLSARAPGQAYNNSDWTFVNDSDAIDRTRAHLVATGKFKASFDMSPLIASRERRSIVGEYTLTAVDVTRGRKFVDVMAEPLSNFDSHGYTIDPLCRLAFPTVSELVPAAVPLRCMLPPGIDGMLVIGIGISAHRDALPIVRMQPDVQNAGYAAGVAAAMAARAGVAVRKVDIKAVQKHLVEKGCIKAESIPQADTPKARAQEVRQAVAVLAAAQVLDGFEVMKAFAVILDAEREVSVPILREAHAAATRAEVKVALAEALAVLGDGSGRETLLAALAGAREWDKGWEFQGMGNHGAGYSRLDSIMLCLANLREQRATPLIAQKLPALGTPREFSHYRCAAMALEQLADPRAAAALAELLRQPGMSGHATPGVAVALANPPAPEAQWRDQNERHHRERTLRELLLAKALYACGDCEGMGRRILEAYAEDVHGVYRVHAREALRKG